MFHLCGGVGLMFGLKSLVLILQVLASGQISANDFDERIRLGRPFIIEDAGGDTPERLRSLVCQDRQLYRSTADFDG